MSNIAFSARTLDRHSTLRNDPAALERARTDPATRFVAIWRNQCLVRNPHLALLAPESVSAYTHDPERCTLLGKQNGRFLFAFAIDADEEPDFGPDTQFIGLREISMRLEAEAAALAAFAKAIISWQDHHRHCGVCGARNRLIEGGFVMACTDHDCGHRSFPRLDPAVIVLVHHQERALLGRQAKWPNRLFSTIAGFVEPGESLEDAIYREVAEETNIRTGHPSYIASQPWPFPAALMIGFHARGRSTDIRLNDGELAEARWVSRQQIVAGDIILPTRFSVAYHLIERWFDRYDGPQLAELAPPDSPIRPPRID